MFLPFLMSVNCVDHFVHCYFIVLIVWMSVQVFTRLSQKALFNLKKRLKKKVLLLYTVPFECEEASVFFFVWGMCWQRFLWWATALWSARASSSFLLLSVAWEHERDVFWTISVFGERERKKSRWSDQELPHLTLFCENADTWNVSRQLLQNWLPFRNATTEPHTPPTTATQR